MSKKTYTYEEVAKHNSRNDLWMVIHNKVFDITPFIDEVSLYKCVSLIANISHVASWWRGSAF